MYRFSYIKNRFSYIKIFVFSILVVCIILLLVIPSCTVRQNYKDSTEYFYNYNNIKKKKKELIILSVTSFKQHLCDRIFS